MTCYSLFCILTYLSLKQAPLLTSVSEKKEIFWDMYLDYDLGSNDKCMVLYNGKNLATVPRVKNMKKYNLTITPETFDNITSVRCYKNNIVVNYYMKLLSYKPPQMQTTKMAIEYYKNSTNFQFDCSFYKSNSQYVHVGRLLNNNLTVFNQWNISRSYIKNGSIFCCYFYTIKFLNNVVQIRRNIRNKTLIIVMDTVDDNTDIFYISVAIELVVFMFITIIIIIFERKTKWFASTLSLYRGEDSNRTTNQIYAELQLTSEPQTHRTPRVEESPYAEICHPDKLMYADLEFCHLNRKTKDFQRMKETPYAEIINPYNNESSQSKEESPYAVIYSKK